VYLFVNTLWCDFVLVSYKGNNYVDMHYIMYFVLGFTCNFLIYYYKICMSKNNMLKYKIQE